MKASIEIEVHQFASTVFCEKSTAQGIFQNYMNSVKTDPNEVV